MSQSTTWVGLDVHKSSITVAILRDRDLAPETLSIDHEPRAIKKLARRLRKDSDHLQVCYEAGPCGFELYRRLKDAGIDCAVIAPSLIPSRPGERIKTDRRDAVKLATLLRAGLLTSIHIPSSEQEALRELARARDVAFNELKAARQRLLKLCLRHGKAYSEGSHWTQRHKQWLRTASFEHRYAQLAFEDFRSHFDYLEERLKLLDTYLEGAARSEPYRQGVDRLRCLHGVDTLTAISVLAEIHDFRRFSSPREVPAFIGIVPREHSSGEREHRGAITKSGNSRLRRLLIEVAWHYDHPSSLKLLKKRWAGQPQHIIDMAQKAYRRLSGRYRHLVTRGKRAPVAVVAVARELCGFIWALMTAPELAEVES